jgi:hypothetical protein
VFGDKMQMMRAYIGFGALLSLACVAILFVDFLWVGSSFSTGPAAACGLLFWSTAALALGVLYIMTAPGSASPLGRVLMEQQRKKEDVADGVIFRGETVTRQQVLNALRHFDRDYPDTNMYDRWLEKDSYKYAVRYGGKLYPCKYILSLARGIENTDFPGGEHTNSRFRKLGFEVIDKPYQES